MDKPKTLIGSDESYVTQSVKVLLAGSFEVTERTSFAEVVREASTGDFDMVIVCGHCLAPPVLCSGGLLENTVATIAAIKLARPVPIISSASTPEWRKPLLAAGADAHLKTPFHAAEFRDAVSHCLSVGGRRGQST